MHVEIPVPNKITAQLNRSRLGTTEDVYACATEVFELRDVSSIDVHFVAEWRQSWNRKDPIELKPCSAYGGSWKDALLSDPTLTRIAMIDGEFYSPLKFADQTGELILVTAGNLAELILRNGSVKDFAGEHGSGFWSGQYKKALSESGYIRFLNDNGADVVPDLKGRTVLKQTADQIREGIRKRLDGMCVIDDAVFVKVDEPMLALFYYDGKVQLRPYGLEALASACDRATSFSMLDYEAAIDFIENNFPDDEFQSFVSFPTIHIPNAFKADRNRAEMLKLVDYLLDYTQEHLRILSKDSGNAWYELRDVKLAYGDEPTARQMDEIADKACAFAVTMAQQQFNDKTLKLIGRTGLMLTERWHLRPVDRELPKP